MGTSASNSGPSDKTPLLPDWAQGTPAPPPAGPPPDASPGGAVPDQGASDPPGQPQEAPAPAGAENVAVQAPSRGPWSLARRAMTSVARAGGGTRRFRVAGGRYVRAKGGAKSAAASSAAGRATTAGLGGFLSGIATGGVAQAAQSIGLQAVVGQRAETVLAAVIDAIAPAGTTNDEAIARRAASETLRELFEKYGVEQNGIEALDAMKAADVAEAVELSVSAYVYQRWLFDLSLKIEEYAVSEAEAVRLERDVKSFVKGLVKFKLNGGKAIGLDWKGAAGKAFVQEVYEAAYRLLGGTPS
jgi:hypothetical protein